MNARHDPVCLICVSLSLSCLDSPYRQFSRVALGFSHTLLVLVIIVHLFDSMVSTPLGCGALLVVSP